MNDPGACAIEKAVTALQEAIEDRKILMQKTQTKAGQSPVLSHLFTEIFKRADGSYNQISHVLENGKEFTQDFLKKAQQGIQERPWEVLVKVAVYSFSIGLFLSLRHRKTPTGEKE